MVAWCLLYAEKWHNRRMWGAPWKIGEYDTPTGRSSKFHVTVITTQHFILVVLFCENIDYHIISSRFFCSPILFFFFHLSEFDAPWKLVRVRRQPSYLTLNEILLDRYE